MTDEQSEHDAWNLGPEFCIAFGVAPPEADVVPQVAAWTNASLYLSWSRKNVNMLGLPGGLSPTTPGLGLEPAGRASTFTFCLLQ